MTKLPSDDELRDAFWTGYAAASWGEKEVSGMRACAVLAIARMNERAAAPEPSEAQDAARYRWLRDPTDFAKLLALHAGEVAVATERYKSCLDATATARREETAALNRLNEAQRQLDKIIAQMRKESPRDSDWRRDEKVYLEIER